MFSGVEGKRWCRGAVDFNSSSYLITIYDTHWVIFYKELVFSAPMSLAVNCFTFNALSYLSDDDTNFVRELPLTYLLTFYPLSISFLSPLLLSLLVVLALTVTVMVTVM
jgi:hypothetical protein